MPPSTATFPEPIAEAGECCIAVAASALSHLARGRATGSHYSAAGVFPFVPGVDGVGRLDDGRRVAFLLPRAPHGGMAERTVVPVSRCVPVPDALDDVAAAALINAGMSSFAAFKERAKLVAGETVLVNGATGAAGRLAVAVARHLGAARVVATGRDASKLARVGADATVPLGGGRVGARCPPARGLRRGDRCRHRLSLGSSRRTAARRGGQFSA